MVIMTPEEMAKDPRFRKALKGLLAPLRQEGDTMTISFNGQSVTIDKKKKDKL